MQRALKQLAENVDDLLIIGGGIDGPCVAWEATLRGLAVALPPRQAECSFMTRRSTT
jgi:glycerol-3-phosphate dehydrogenase